MALPATNPLPRLNQAPSRAKPSKIRDVPRRGTVHPSRCTSLSHAAAFRTP
jgi:hypothetical protein